MDTIREFKFERRKIRVIQIDGEPWFVVKDICRALELTNTTVTARRLDTCDCAYSTIQNNPVRVITETGLYELLLRSEKTNAKQFARWIISKVMPKVRKTSKKSASNCILNAEKVQELIDGVNMIQGMLVSQGFAYESQVKSLFNKHQKQDEPKYVLEPANNSDFNISVK